MKAFLKDFCLRGMVSAWGGPVVLGIVYALLDATGAVPTLSTGEVAVGILSLTVLAFFVAGMTAIYQVEQLPLPTAILIHGGVLYLLYLAAYFVNGWLAYQGTDVLIFSGIFLCGYAIIWGIIYLFNRKRIQRLNRKLRERTD